MKTRNRGLTTFLISALSVFLVSGLWAQAKTPVELTMTIYTDQYKEGAKAVVDAINADPKLGVHLNVDPIPGGEPGLAVLKIRYAANEIADLYYGNGASDVKLANGLSKLVQLTGAWRSNFDPSILGAPAYTADGKLYGVPQGSVNIGGMLYNKKVFKDLGLSIPKTHAELLAVAAKIKAAGKIPVYVSGKDTWTLQIYSIVGYSREWSGKDAQATQIVQAVDKNQAKIADRKLFWDSLAKYKELFDKGYVNKTWQSDTYDMAQEALANGDAAMYPMATWVLGDIATKFPDKVNDIGGFAIPFDGNDHAAAWTPFSLVLNKTTKNMDAALKVVEFMGSAKAAEIYAKAQPGIPAAKGVTVDLLPAQKDLYQIFSTPGRGGLVFQALDWPDGPAFDTKFPDVCARVLAGASTVEQEAKIWDDARIRAGQAQKVPGY